jgi:hypothetical protein
LVAKDKKYKFGGFIAAEATARVKALAGAVG